MEGTILRFHCAFGWFRAKDGGAEGIRTPDPLNAIQVLFQLSYSPTLWESDTLQTAGNRV